MIIEHFIPFYVSQLNFCSIFYVYFQSCVYATTKLRFMSLNNISCVFFDTSARGDHFCIFVSHACNEKCQSLK